MQMQKGGPFACGYPGCGSVFMEMSNLRCHERSHITPAYSGYQLGDANHEPVNLWPTGNPNICESCNEQFENSMGLEMHIMQFHTQDIVGPSDSFTQNAPYYPQTVSDTYVPMQYSQSLSFGEARRFPCPYCSKRFDTRTGIDVHMRTHTRERPFICSYPGCGKAFSVKSNMRRHERTHTANSAFEPVVDDSRQGNALANKHGCPSCNQQFNRPNELEKHMERSHPAQSSSSRSVESARRPAPFHTQMFSQAAEQQSYYPPLPSGTTPEDTTPYPSYSGAQFHSTSIQQTHMQTYTGEKPFRCSYIGCDKAYSVQSNLSRHERTHVAETRQPDEASKSLSYYNNPSYW